MNSLHHDGQTYLWNGGSWTLNGNPIGLSHQIALSRAYLAELQTAASEKVPDETVLRDLARTDPQLLESALDYCSVVLRRNPEHRGARALHLTIRMKLEQFAGLRRTS